MKRILNLIGVACLIVVCVIAAIGFRAWSRFNAKPLIQLTNESGITLKNVVISGNGFKQHYSEIPDGIVQSFTATVAGESGVDLGFTAGTQEIEERNMSYIETSGGYKVKV